MNNSGFRTVQGDGVARNDVEYLVTGFIMKCLYVVVKSFDVMVQAHAFQNSECKPH